MKIYIIRHCESEDDLINTYGGCADYDLTDKGRLTALNHVKKIKNLGIEKIFTSPYKRAKHVADIFHDHLKCDYEIIDGLKGMNIYGVLSGLNKEHARELFDYLFTNSKYVPFGYYTGKSFKGGESVQNFDERIKKSFDIIARCKYKVVAVVTHGGVFRSFYKNILKQSKYINDISDVGTLEVEYNNGKFYLINTKGVTFSKK